jgi:Spy/CpxP family protein refolding chaperone
MTLSQSGNHRLPDGSRKKGSKMKKQIIVTTLTLGLAGALYAGQGSGNYGQGMQGGQGKGMMAQQSTVSGGAVGMGQGKGHGKQGRVSNKKRRPNHLQRMLRTLNKELNLSPEQKQRVKAIVTEYRQALKAKRMERKQARKGKGMGRGKGKQRGAAAFMNPERFDKEAFKSTVQKRWEMQEQRRAEWRKARLDLMADTMEKLYNVLTPEQRSRLIELSQKRRGRK